MDTEGSRDMNRRREGVIGGLTGIDLVVGMDAHARELAKPGEHLVHIHIRARARPGLEDIDGEGIVIPPLGDALRRGGNGLRLLRRQHPELRINLRRSTFDARQGMNDRRFDGDRTDREVLDRPLGLGAPQHIPGDSDLPEGIVLDAGRPIALVRDPRHGHQPSSRRQPAAVR